MTSPSILFIAIGVPDTAPDCRNLPWAMLAGRVPVSGFGQPTTSIPVVFVPSKPPNLGPPSWIFVILL